MCVSYSRIKYLLLLILIATPWPGALLAQASECGENRGTMAGALDESTWKRLNDVYEDVGDERLDAAYDKLQKMLPRAHGGYQQAVLAQAMAQVEWARANYDAALENFETVVRLDALPDAAHYSLMYQIAQLYYTQDRFDDALERLVLWMCKVPNGIISADAYYLKAAIHTSQQDWINVIAAVGTAISISETARESWYQLKLGAHFELGQLTQAAQTLETLIQHWPDEKDYWIQLAQIYYQQQMEQESLAVLALAKRRDMLDKQSDILFLSSLYSNSEVPLKAASVLQSGIEDGLVKSNKKHWTMVADAWFTAGEMGHALVAYEKAGEVSDNGEIDLRRAYILVELERWDEASVAISYALKKGGLDELRTGEALLLLGMSEFNFGNYEKAAAAWNRAYQYSQTKKSAQQWLNYMREDQIREQRTRPFS